MNLSHTTSLLNFLELKLKKAGDIAKVTDLSVYDHLQSKVWAIRLAADAAITILKVDQVRRQITIKKNTFWLLK